MSPYALECNFCHERVPIEAGDDAEAKLAAFKEAHARCEFTQSAYGSYADPDVRPYFDVE